MYGHGDMNRRVASIATSVVLLVATAPRGIAETISGFAAVQDPAESVPVSESYATDASIGSAEADASAPHAQSWAVSQVTPTNVIKAASGRGWIEQDSNSAWFAWNAATGDTTLPPTDVTSVRFVIRNSGDPDLPENGFSSTDLASGPAEVSLASQQLFVDPSGNSNEPEFFEVHLALDAFIQQGTEFLPLFEGTASLTPKVAGDDSTGLIQTGDFLARNVFTEQVDLASGRTSATIDTDVVGFPVFLDPDQPLDIFFDLFVTMGDSARMFDLPMDAIPVQTAAIFSGLQVPIGGGGSLVVEIELIGKLGDMDRDGDVDFDDIDDFVLGQMDAAAYEMMFGVPPALRGDTDRDNDLDFDDIPGFIVALGGGAPMSGLQAIPEPSCLVHMAIAMLTVFGLSHMRNRVLKQRPVVRQHRID